MVDGRKFFSQVEIFNKLRRMRMFSTFDLANGGRVSIVNVPLTFPALTIYGSRSHMLPEELVHGLSPDCGKKVKVWQDSLIGLIFTPYPIYPMYPIYPIYPISRSALIKL